MATLARDIRLSVLADIAKYQKDFAKIPGITEKTAAAAAIKFEREIRQGQERAARSAEKSAKQASNAWGDVGTLIAGQLSADALKAAGEATLSFVSDTMEARLAVIRLSNATGIGRDTIAGLEEAFRSVGADGREATDQLQDFAEKLFDFGQGGGAAQEALSGLGFDMEAVRSGAIGTDEALRMVLDRLPRLTDDVQKAAFAQQLFSDRGLDVTNALENLPLEEAIAQAQRFGRVVDDDAAAATAQWTENLNLLSGSMNAAKVETIDFINPASQLDGLLIGLVATSAALSESMKILRNSIRSASEGLGQFALGEEQERIVGVEEAARQAAQAFQEARAEAKGLAAEGLEVAISMEDMAEALGFGSAMAEASAEETRELAKQQRIAAAAAKAQQRAIEDLLKAGLAAGEDLLSAEERVIEARDQDLNKIRELGEASGDEALAEVFAEDRKQQAIRETRELRIAALQEQVAQARQAREAEEAAEVAVADALRQRNEDAEAEAKERALRQIEVAEAVGDNTLLIASTVAQRNSALQQEQLEEQREIVESLAARRVELQGELEQAETRRQRRRIRGEIATLDAIQAAERQKLRAEKRERLNAFKAEKAVALAGVGFNTGVAILKAYALFGPPPSPAGIAAAGIATGAGIIQAGIIATEKPPQLHQGFSGFPSFSGGPDERAVILRQNEPVLNQRAGETLGREAVQQLNQTGQMPQGAQIFELNFERRHVDALVVPTIRAGGRLRRVIAKVGGAGPRGVRRVFNR